LPNLFTISQHRLVAALGLIASVFAVGYLVASPLVPTAATSIVGEIHRTTGLSKECPEDQEIGDGFGEKV